MAHRMRAPANNPIRLRRARLADLDALVALEIRAFRVDIVTRRSFRRFLTVPSADVIAAEWQGELAGYALVLFRPNTPIARLYSIAVAPQFAGNGIGPALLDAAEKAARKRGRTVMRLEVHIRNTRAIRRYRHAGYQLFGHWPDYYDDGAPALRFDKDLAGAAASRRRKAVKPAQKSRRARNSA